MSANTEADREAALALLSPEERAAIVDELSDDEKAALAAIASGDDDDDAEAETAAAAKPAVKVAPVEPAVAVTPAVVAAAPVVAAVPAAAVVVEDDDLDAPFKPHYKVELPADFADQLKAVDDAEVALADKFKAGDVDVNEFLAEQRKIANDRAKLDKIQTKADTFEDLNAQAGAQEWDWHVGRFLRKVDKAEGINYATDPVKGPDFDNFVKALASRPENKDKDFTWFLDEAHKRVKALHGIADKPVVIPSKEDKPAGRPAPVGKLPATLALVPGGDGPGDVGGDEFANLDALTGMEYEVALAKLPKEVRERYLAAA